MRKEKLTKTKNKKTKTRILLFIIINFYNIIICKEIGLINTKKFIDYIIIGYRY